MALENLVDGMTGLQMANAIKNNFDKVLDAESAENKAENAGLSIKTDYDATRYIDLQLADGTPVKMKMDVFCQAIAPVVAEQISVNRRQVTLASNGTTTFTTGYGMIVISSSTLGYTGVFFKTPSEVVLVKESAATANVVLTNNGEYSFTLTNKSSSAAAFNIVLVGGIVQ